MVAELVADRVVRQGDVVGLEYDGVDLVVAEGYRIFYRPDFQQVSVAGQIDESYVGPVDFDAILVGETDTYSALKDSVITEGRWETAEDLAQLPVRVEVTTLSTDVLRKGVAEAHIRTITGLANTKEGPEKASNRREYKRALNWLVQDLLEANPISAGSSVIVPLRAAKPVANLMGIPLENQLEVHEKRLPFIAGNQLTGEEELGVGISIDNPADWGRLLSIKNGEATVVEGCLATSFTIKQLMQLAIHMDAKPDKLTIYAGAITQQGAEDLIGFCEEKGIELNIFAGALAYALDEKCYILTDEGEYFVGDAGDFVWPGEEDVWINETSGEQLRIVGWDESGELQVEVMSQGEDDGSFRTSLDPLGLLNDSQWREVLDENQAQEILDGFTA